MWAEMADESGETERGDVRNGRVGDGRAWAEGGIVSSGSGGMMFGDVGFEGVLEVRKWVGEVVLSELGRTTLGSSGGMRCGAESFEGVREVSSGVCFAAVGCFAAPPSEVCDCCFVAVADFSSVCNFSSIFAAHPKISARSLRASSCFSGSGGRGPVGRGFCSALMSSAAAEAAASSGEGWGMW